MEFITLTPERYKEWDSFCLVNDDAWFWHTTSWMRYSLIYRLKLQSKNYSFFVYDGGRLVALAPLFLETYDEGFKEFSFGGDFGPGPVCLFGMSAQYSKKIIDGVFAHVDQLALAHGVRRVRFRAHPLRVTGAQSSANLFVPYGYIDFTIATRVLDLSPSLDVIRRDVRHGHDADIVRAAKSLTTRVVDSENFHHDLFLLYADLHKQCATLPRVQETYDIMEEVLQRENGMIILAYLGERVVGASYFFLYKQMGYYGSSCKVSDVDLPIAHLIQWHAITWMKEHELTRYELGWQHHAVTLSEIPTQKEIAISQFKRGFGGVDVPLFRGEKYYDAAFMKTILDERVQAVQKLI